MPLTATIGIISIGENLLFSILLMAVLYLLFYGVKMVGKLSALSLYYIAVLFQAVGIFGFIISLLNTTESIATIGFINFYYETNLSNYVSFVYSLVTLFFILKLIVGFKNLHKISSTGLAINENIQQHVNDVLQAYMPFKNVAIKWVHQAALVFTYGFIKPIIVLPIACLNNLTEDELTAIILHEIAHIKYAHFVINIWVELVSAVLWFNPFNYWLHKEINFYREASADAFVLQQTENSICYANSLYKLALQTIPTKQAMALPAVNTKNELLRRIQLFTHQKLAFSFSYKRVFICFLAFTFLFGINELSHQHVKQVNSSKQVVTEKPVFNLTNLSSKINKEEKQIENKIIEKTKLIAKKKKQTKQESIYLLEDKKEFAQGLKFLSELAIQNPTVENIVTNNPTIIPVALQVEDNKEKVRRFIIPPTKTKGAVLVKITVEQKPNNKPKVTIELEEQTLIEAS